MTKIKIAVLSISLICASTLVANNVFAADGEYESNGAVQFVPNTDPTLPVDPENPDPTNPVKPIDPTNPEGPQPGTAGPLSLDYASSLHFGMNKISSADEVYLAAAQGFSETIAGEHRGNYVQVTDNRGSLAGWTLMVAQQGQFLSETAKKYHELHGAVIKFSDSAPDSISKAEVEAPKTFDFELDPSGASSLVMSAAEGAGAGTWVDYFGQADLVNGEHKNEAITLSVPGATPKEATEYRTVLTWSLTDAPGR